MLKSVNGEEKIEFDDDSEDDFDNFILSAYDDMLNDYDRNLKYESAIQEAVRHVKSRQNEVNVLDIGTGSGLLSIIAAKAGASLIIACERQPTVCKAAKKMFRLNKCSDVVTLMELDAMKLKDDHFNDISKFHIVTSELLDSQLIGENVCEIISHIKSLKKCVDAIFIPHSATIYCQLFQSSFIGNMFMLNGEVKNNIPFDYKLDSLKFTNKAKWSIENDRSYIFPITEPIPIIKNFQMDEKLLSNKFRITAKNSGNVQAILLWWELEMLSDDFPSITISTAPYWINERICTRNHWMQRIYYAHPLVGDVRKFDKNEKFELMFGMNENDFVFGLISTISTINNKPVGFDNEKIKRIQSSIPSSLMDVCMTYESKEDVLYFYALMETSQFILTCSREHLQYQQSNNIKESIRRLAEGFHGEIKFVNSIHKEFLKKLSKKNISFITMKNHEEIFKKKCGKNDYVILEPFILHNTLRPIINDSWKSFSLEHMITRNELNEFHTFPMTIRISAFLCRLDKDICNSHRTIENFSDIDFSVYNEQFKKERDLISTVEYPMREFNYQTSSVTFKIDDFPLDSLWKPNRLWINGTGQTPSTKTESDGLIFWLDLLNKNNHCRLSHRNENGEFFQFFRQQVHVLPERKIIDRLTFKYSFNTLDYRFRFAIDDIDYTTIRSMDI
ncbi:hypothetical protein SNEBB_007492 [Seison nebaliae]|nr:hypothetical protein SNEBB_007492 [Seison nebaliae]